MVTSSVPQPVRPHWGIGRTLLSVWIVLTSVALITGAGGRRYFLVVGVLSIVVVAVLVTRVVVDRLRHGPAPAIARPRRALAGTLDPSGRPATAAAPTPLTRLRAHDEIAANQVQVALDLLRGQLVALLGKDETGRARKAIESTLAEYATVDQAIERSAAARSTLTATLRRSELDPGTDGEAVQLGKREDELRRQQAETVGRLRHAAAGLQAAWEPVRDQQIVRVRRGELSRARDDAEAVSAQGLPTADASAGLTDAIDELEGSLGGLREVGGINDRILGDDNVPIQPAPGNRRRAVDPQ